jgi:radical SAM protein with 4Fe4S-binding SPASM domain
MMAFTGGEPLMRPDLFELLAYSRALGFTNTLATNAMLIDNETARRLKRNGVKIAAVSLDGFDAPTHDHVRDRAGSFEATLKGVRALNRAGILLHINMTAMALNMDQMGALCSLVDELRAGILLIYQLVNLGRGRSLGDEALDLESNERLIHTMARVQRNSRAIMEPVAGPQYWAYLLKRAGINGGPRLRIAEKVFHGCSAGRGFVYIKPNGEVWPCPFVEVNCGNVRETPFETIWSNAAPVKQLREREKSLKGSCGECEYQVLCGGCRGRAWALSSDYLAADPSCFIHPPDTIH